MRDSRASNPSAEPFRAVLAILPRWILVVALAGASALRAQTTTSPPGESEVKATFVLNFIRFVTWSGIQGENSVDLPVCALANSDFANAIKLAVSGKLVQGRAISFTLDVAPDPSRCRVLIVDVAQYPIAAAPLHAVSAAPVLTIGNGPGFMEIGGMFELILENRKIRFDANLNAVRQAGLSMNAYVFQLSRNLAKK